MASTSRKQIFKRQYRPDVFGTVGGWIYDDPDEHTFAYRCSLERFALPAFDQFVESLDEGANKSEFIKWRAEALNFYRSGNLDAWKTKLETMWVAWTAYTRIGQLSPPARHGLKFPSGRR